MFILWVMRHAGYVRNYEPVLRALAGHGHRIHMGCEVFRNKMGEDTLVRRLHGEFPLVTYGPLPIRERTTWTVAAEHVRAMRDYAHYWHPRYRSAPLLRDRARKFLAPRFLHLIDGLGRLGHPAVNGLDCLLKATERAMEPSRTVMEYLGNDRPDVVLVTPLVEFGSQQVDYLKAAARLGIPSALGVASWDNLTNKGLIRWSPDRVFVWNEPQVKEAIEIHEVPADRVVVTGAQIFDHWFEMKPSRTHEEFCRYVGLDPTHPFVLYLGSSFFLAPTEAAFGDTWVEGIRRSADPSLAAAGVLIRPHPSNGIQWQHSNVRSHDNVSIWPPLGMDAFSTEYKADFYDSIYYAAAVVGINTSAQIEAAILGKSVCTVREESTSRGQEGTLHFQHLAGSGSDDGLLIVAPDLDIHLAQLADFVSGRRSERERSQRFVARFVRPRGLDQAASPILTDAIEKLAGDKTHQPAMAPWWGPLQRMLMAVPVWLVVPTTPRHTRSWKPRPLRAPVSAVVFGFYPVYRTSMWVTRLWEQARVSAREGMKSLRRGRKRQGRLLRKHVQPERWASRGRLWSRRAVKQLRYGRKAIARGLRDGVVFGRTAIRRLTQAGLTTGGDREKRE